MKAASAELIAHLSGARELRPFDLYEISLLSGTTLRYTDCDRDLRWDGHTWQGPGAPLLSRSRVRLVAGLEVDSLDLEIRAGEEHSIDGAPLMQALHQGALDGAEVTLRRAFLDSDLSVIGAICGPRPGAGRWACGRAWGPDGGLPCWASPTAGRATSSAADSSAREERLMQLTCWDSWDRRRPRAWSSRCSAPDP